MNEEGVKDAIVMDKKTFRSLTSETRLKILKLLKERNHTITEIAQKLAISKTSAKEHIDILVEGRLVEPVPSSNIWKYYTLTDDGKKLLGSETPQKVVILISTTIIGVLMMLYGFSYYFLPQEGSTDMKSGAEVQPMLTKSIDSYSPEVNTKKESSDLRFFVGLLGIFLILIVFFELSKKRKVII